MLNEETHKIAEHALAYLQPGWKLVMMDHGTKGPTHAGWNTPSELVDTLERAIDRLNTGPQNMGLVHKASGTGAVDVDDEAWSRHILDTFGIDYDDLMGRSMRIWSKPNRDKAIFVGVPEDMPLLKIQWPTVDATKATDRMTIIELRAGPNQDVLPPSRHPDGHFYQWWPGTAPWELETLPTIPRNLLDFWQALGDRKTGLREEIENLCPWKKQQVGKRYVQRARSDTGANGNVIGQFNAATDVGDMLEAAGYKRKGKRYLAPSSSTVIPGVVILDDKCYSHHGSDPLADGYAHDAFDLLCTLHHNDDVGAAIRDAAQQLGIDRERPQAAPDMDMVIDLDAVLAAQAKRKLQTVVAPEQVTIDVPTVGTITNVPSSDFVYPPELFKPPGMAGVITEWILQTSRQPQPILAVTGALALLSVALGRKVMSPTRARTNNYFICLADSGFGKEHSRDCILEALTEAGFGPDGKANLVGGDDLASGPGLKSAMIKQPNAIFLLDEFGSLLHAIGNKTASNSERAIADVFKKLFSNSGKVMMGTEYANKKMNERIDIPYPHACLYATTVPGKFYDNLNADAVSSGFLNRMMIVEAPSMPPTYQSGVAWGVPHGIVDWLRAVRSIMPGLEDNGRYPVSVPYAPMAEALLLQFRAELEARGIKMRADPSRAALADVWARAHEHAIKIALVLSCAKVTDPAVIADAGKNGCLEIDQASVEWAILFVRTVMGYMETAAATRMGESDLDRVCQGAQRAVAKAAGRGCTVGDLITSCKPFRALDPRMQDTVIEMLKRRGDAAWMPRQSHISGQKSVLALMVPEFWVVTESDPL